MLFVCRPASFPTRPLNDDDIMGCFLLLPPEVLYEDLQYLSVSALALAAVAALLMLTMWLLNKLYGKIVAWRRSKRGEDELDWIIMNCWCFN